MTDMDKGEVIAAFTEAEHELRIAMRCGPAWSASDQARPGAPIFPDFLVIGAQKAGTTWLHRNLNFHPDVWLPPVKELNYFNEVYLPSTTGWESQDRIAQANDAKKYFDDRSDLSLRATTKRNALNTILENELTDAWYERIFSHAGDDMVCGEISPEYALLPRRAIARIVARNPKIRVFLIMRDPIDRAWSNAVMTAGREGAGDAAALLRDPVHRNAMYGRSNYPGILTRWIGCAGRNVQVLSFDDLACKPLGLLQGICAKLGIAFDERFFPEAAATVREGGSLSPPQDLLDLLRTEMKPTYEVLVRMQPEIAAPWLKRHYGEGV